MTFKKKTSKKALAKLRDGSHLLAPIQETIDHALEEGDNDPTLEDYEAVGGDLNNLKGEALYAYLNLQTERQHRQINHNNTELQDTIGRISDVLNEHGFLASLQVDDPKTERESTFFHIIAECEGKEEDLKLIVAEYIDIHATKAKHQYEAMKEIEQWFLDLLGDKTMEQEFNDELAHIRVRHDEQAITHQCVEDALARVQMTVQKLRDLGYILILSSAEGVNVFDGPPPDRNDTVTLLVPTESGSDVRFHFTVILDDEAMFRDPKVQLLAQQYLKGMIFYGSAAKHKNRAQKRKVIRLMMRQLEAIYNFITRLRNALTVTEKEGNHYKSRVEELQVQKDQAYGDRERYRIQVDEAEPVLKKIMDEKDGLRLTNIMLQDKLKQAERDFEQCKARTPPAQESTRTRHSTKTQQAAAPAAVTVPVPIPNKISGVSVGRVQSVTNVAMPSPMLYAGPKEDKEIQVGSLPTIVHVSRGLSVQESLIAKTDMEVQPSFEALSSEQREEFDEAKDQVAALEDTVGQLNGELGQLKEAHEALERRASELAELVKQGEARRAIEEAAIEKIRATTTKAEDERKEFLAKQRALEDEVEGKISTIRELQILTASQSQIIHARDHQTINMNVTTELDIFGTSTEAQTIDYTPGEVKVEFQKLKSAMADFRRNMISVLVGQNLIADIPSFPEQLRDNWNANSAAAEITADVKEHFEAFVDIRSASFNKVNAKHQKAFQIVLAKKAAEIENKVQGVDSSEEMRKVRLKLRQRVLDLKVENSQMHDTLRTLTKLLEEHRSDYESQLDQKDEKFAKQREDIRRMKDLAWTLAEGLAKLRDEAVSNMPERKSLIDMMQLLQIVEQRLGKKLRTPEETKKAALNLLVQGTPLSDPSSNALKLPKASNLNMTDSTYSLQEVPTGIFGQQVNRQNWSPEEKPAVSTRDKRSSPIRFMELIAATKGTSTSDRVARTALEYTRYFIDPEDGWTIRTQTREVAQVEIFTQTDDDTLYRRKKPPQGQAGEQSARKDGTGGQDPDEAEDYDDSDDDQNIDQGKGGRDRNQTERKRGGKKRPETRTDLAAVDQFGRPVSRQGGRRPGDGSTPRSQTSPGGHVYFESDSPGSEQDNRTRPRALQIGENLSATQLSSQTVPVFDLYGRPVQPGYIPSIDQQLRSQYQSEHRPGLDGRLNDIRDPRNIPSTFDPARGSLEQQAGPISGRPGQDYTKTDRWAADPLNPGQFIRLSASGSLSGPQHSIAYDPTANYEQDLIDPDNLTHLHPAHPIHGLNMHDPTGGMAALHVKGAVRAYFHEDGTERLAEDGSDALRLDDRYDMAGGVFGKEHGPRRGQPGHGGFSPGEQALTHGPGWRADHRRDGQHGESGPSGYHSPGSDQAGSQRTPLIAGGQTHPNMMPITGRPFDSGRTFGSPGAGTSPEHQYRGQRINQLSPQEQSEAAKLASEQADAILSDMECIAAQQVFKIRRSRSATPSPTGSPGTTAPPTRTSTPDSSLQPGSPQTFLSPPASDGIGSSGRSPLSEADGGAAANEANQNEAYHLNQLAKLRRARMHVSEVRNRLTNLENGAVQHAQMLAEQEKLDSREPAKPKTPDGSDQEGEDDAGERSPDMTKKSLETLRQEAEVIKGDLKVLQRGHKALGRRPTSPKAADTVALLAKFTAARKVEMDREQRIQESKTQRRKKMEGLGQEITKFVKHGPAWQKALDEVEEKAHGHPGVKEQSAGQGAIKKTAARTAGEKAIGELDTDLHVGAKMKPHLSPARPRTAQAQESAKVLILEKDKPAMNMTTRGIGVGSPKDPLMGPKAGLPDDFTQYSDTMHSKVPLKRKEKPLSELVDGSITRKLKYLKEQRLSQAPLHAEKQMKNPVIRTHRGEEPFEGPVDLAPFNFPEIGVIGRPIPHKLAKSARLQWDQEQSVPHSAANDDQVTVAPERPAQGDDIAAAPEKVTVVDGSPTSQLSSEAISPPETTVK